MANREKKPKTIQGVKLFKAKIPADSEHQVAEMVTAFEDIILTIGIPNTETGHRIKLIAERAIARAQGKLS